MNLDSEKQVEHQAGWIRNGASGEIEYLFSTTGMRDALNVSPNDGIKVHLKELADNGVLPRNGAKSIVVRIGLNQEPKRLYAILASKLATRQLSDTSPQDRDQYWIEEAVYQIFTRIEPELRRAIAEVLA